MHNSLLGAVESLVQSRGKNAVERIRLLGLNPKHDLAGGDWRNVDFSDCDLTDADFRNARLHKANFHHALVSGADFRGASDLHTTYIQFAYGWREAIMDEAQVVMVEGLLEARERRERAKMELTDWIRLINDTPDYDTARSLLEEMQRTDFAINPYAYTITLKKARSARDKANAQRLFQTYRHEQGFIDLPLYTAALDTALNVKQAMDLANDAWAHGLKPDQYFYNALISKQFVFNDAMRLVGRMERENVRISEFTGYSLFDSCRTFANCVTVLLVLHRHGVNVFSDQMIYEIIDRTDDPANTRDVVKAWWREGADTKTALLRLVSLRLRASWKADALAKLRSPTPHPSSTPR